MFDSREWIGGSLLNDTFFQLFSGSHLGTFRALFIPSETIQVGSGHTGWKLTGLVVVRQPFRLGTGRGDCFDMAGMEAPFAGMALLGGVF